MGNIKFYFLTKLTNFDRHSAEPTTLKSVFPVQSTLLVTAQDQFYVLQINNKQFNTFMNTNKQEMFVKFERNTSKVTLSLRLESRHFEYPRPSISQTIASIAF